MESLALINSCPYILKCSGCSSSDSLQVQRSNKEFAILEIFKKHSWREPQNLTWADLPGGNLRDRLDFRYENQKLGLLSKELDSLVDLSSCAQLSIPLSLWLQDFRAIPIPILDRGTLRLRVSPSGLRGVWFDFSNLAVQKLFAEQNYLWRLLELGVVVEIGQRRKPLVLKNGTLKLLKTSQLTTWSRTWTKNGVEIQLLHRIADFSQAGDASNRAIIQGIHQILDPLHIQGQVWTEFGSGAGNLTFALASHQPKITAYEWDDSLIEGLKSNPHFDATQLDVRSGNAHQLDSAVLDSDGVLVNPARSGTGLFLKNLNESKAENLIYLSCYPESWSKDLEQLNHEQWQCENLIFIDQFPHTSHLEILSHWRRPLRDK
jgi:tRNA/tmRNA/rRNA uracil-C5-methylase (TrmA/RlmC/RlmD family)